MEEELELDPDEQVKAFQRSIATRIILESDKLTDVLLSIAYDEDEEAKVRLSAISMLYDRGLPKLGVQHSKEEETEERGSRKAIREEIEKMFLGDD